MLFGALVLPLFTSLMSASDYGIVGMVVTVTTALDIFVTVGFDVAFSRFYFDDKDPEHRNKVVTHVFYIDFVYPAVLLGILIAFMPQIAQLVMGGPGYTVYFDIGVATLFFQNLSDLPFQLMRLDHRPWTFTSFVIARVVIQLPMAAVFLAVFHWGPEGYLLANLIVAILLNIGALPFWLPRIRLLWDWPLMKGMIDFALPAMFSAVSFYFLKLSDRFFLLANQGKAEVGLYTIANSLSQPIYMVGMAFRMAWPQWHYAKLNEPALHKRMIARSSTYFMLANTVLLVVAGMYLPLGLHLLLNHRFWSVGPTTLVLTLSVALYNLYFIFWVGSNVAKKNRLIPLITLVASGVNVGLNSILVPHFGMWAAAWTTAIGFGLLALQVYFISNKWYPIRFEWRRLIILACSAALTLGVAWVIGHAAGLSVYEPLGKLFVDSLLITPALLVFPVLFRVTHFFTPEESAQLRRVLRRLTLRGGRAGAVPAAAAAGAGVGAPNVPILAREYGPPDRLTEDDLEAEAETAEVEAEVDAVEGRDGQL